MASQFRLLLLALVLVYSLVVGPDPLFASGTKMQREKTVRFKVQAMRWFRVKQIAPPKPLGERIVEYAKRFIGTPYVWAGSSPGGFDCSGLVRYVYSHFGIDLPHSSYADFNLGRSVSRWALKPGDLVFFSGLGHVGMYIGHGRFIHAPHSGTTVQVTPLNSSYGASYDGARRIVSSFKRHVLSR